MSVFHRPIRTQHDLLVRLLEEAYHAEHQIARCLGRMINRAADRELCETFIDQLDETNCHVARLQEAFRLSDLGARGTSSPAIDGLLRETSRITSNVQDRAVLQAALVGSAQAIKHYEIARYGTLVALAGRVGRLEITTMFAATLEEEVAADRRLTALSSRINRQSALPGGANRTALGLAGHRAMSEARGGP